MKLMIFIIYYTCIYMIIILYQVAKFGLLVVEESSKPQIQKLIFAPCT